MTNYEYLLIKRAGNNDGLIYDKKVFNNSKEAREDFKKGDILLKCKNESIYYGDNFKGWSVDEKDVIKKYEK